MLAHEKVPFGFPLGFPLSGPNLNIQRFILSSLTCCALACLPSLAGAGQLQGVLRDFAVRTWTKADGLPDDSVTTLLQTSDGYLWLGTGTGLVRFDGVKFTQIPLFEPGPQQPVSITALSEDAAGRLWVGTQEQGLFCRCTGEAGAPRRAEALRSAGFVTHYGKAEGLLDDNVTSLTTDAEGRLWIGTRHGVNRWEAGVFSSLTTRDGLADYPVTSVQAAKSGTVWITAQGGTYQWSQDRLTPYHPEGIPGPDPEVLRAYEDVRGDLWAFCPTYVINLAKTKRINYFPGEKTASMRTWSLCEGRGGRLWIGASGRGVFYFDGADFQPVMLNEGRWPNDVRAICEDHEGNLWLGISGGGLTQVRWQSLVLLRGNQGLPAGAATCLTLDAGGRLCVGMESGGVYASMGERFERLADGTSFVDQDAPTSLGAGPDGSLWVGTFGTGLCRIKGGRTAGCTTANGLSDDCVPAVCSDMEGNMWAGTQSGALHRFAKDGLTRFDKSDGLPGTPITALLAAHEGGLWVGTGNGVLLRSDPQFVHFASVGLSPKLSGQQILGLYEDTDRTLWFGTAGAGLGCVAAKGCSAWDTQDGLPDDVISGLVGDADGNLWLVTGKGLCRVTSACLAQALARGTPLKARVLFETEAGATGVPTVGSPRALRSPEGRLWFATTSGLVGIDPGGWEAEKPAPHVHLEAVLVDNRPLDLPPAELAGAAQRTRPLRLPSSFRALELQFTALSFEAPEKIRFRHKLELDADWSETGPDRRVKYGRLPSGRYQFQVTACNAEGVWNETGATLAFVIPTPLWRAPWALGFYGLGAAGGVAGAVRLVSHRRLRRRLARLEQQQAMERERVRIAQDMHDEIGSKLTKISFLCERVNVGLEERGPLADKIGSIAGTSRELLQALDEIVWAVNPRNDTLEQLGAYLSQYAREYFQDTPVECDVSLQGELPHLAMSAEVRHNFFVAFEESLNNVLKHSGASKVRIELGVGEGRLSMSVSDNGRGFENPPDQARPDGAVSKGNGLGNMRQRLRDVGGQCTIQSRLGKGTTVSMSLSLTSPKLAAQ